jgi:hypothetical protein
MTRTVLSGCFAAMANSTGCAREGAAGAGAITINGAKSATVNRTLKILFQVVVRERATTVVVMWSSSLCALPKSKAGLLTLFC